MIKKEQDQGVSLVAEYHYSYVCNANVKEKTPKFFIT